MKKTVKIIRGILILAICSVIIIGARFAMCLAKYTITPERAQIKDALLQFINRPTVIDNTIEIEQEINLDNKKYVLIKTENYEGEAELTKGLNNKYKIYGVGYGTSILKSEIRKTNKGKYLLIFCRNKNKNIQYANVKIENKEYKIDFPKADYVIAYYKVPNNTKVKFIGLSNIKFFSDDNKDITQDFLTNY